MDHLEEIEAQAKTECVLPIYTDDSMDDEIQRIFEETGVCIEEQLRQFLMYVNDHEELIEKWKNEGMMTIPEDYEMMRLS